MHFPHQHFLTDTANYLCLKVNSSPNSKADVLQDVGQRDISCLKGLSLLPELVCQADSPTLLGHSISHLLGDVPTHEVRCAFLTPLCSHSLQDMQQQQNCSSKREQVQGWGLQTGSCHHSFSESLHCTTVQKLWGDSYMQLRDQEVDQ